MKCKQEQNLDLQCIQNNMLLLLNISKLYLVVRKTGKKDISWSCFLSEAIFPFRPNLLFYIKNKKEILLHFIGVWQGEGVWSSCLVCSGGLFCLCFGLLIVCLFVQNFFFYLTSITRFVDVVCPQQVTVRQPSTKQIRALCSILSTGMPSYLQLLSLFPHAGGYVSKHCLSL